MRVDIIIEFKAMKWSWAMSKYMAYLFREKKKKKNHIMLYM